VRALVKRRRRSSAPRSDAVNFAALSSSVRPRGFFSAFRCASVGFLSLALLAGCFLSGCRKKTLSPGELHAVTTEIVSAAEHVSTPKPEVTIRPEVRDGAGGKVPADHIYVTLPNDSEVAALRQAVEAIAHRHHLDVAETGTGVRRFDLTYRGERTHSIHVVTPLAGRPRLPEVRGAGAPRLAIIIDDLGNDRSAADSLMALPFPLTISVLPHLPLSGEIAEEAYRRNDGVMLHLPMQSEGEGAPSEGTKPEEIELRVGMNRGQVREIVSSMLDTVPHAAGVNNHQGSRATADPALMQDVMGEIRARNLFFIDSRTTASTVAYETARTAGVRAASRKVFLDDTPTREAVLAQLELAARDAARDGSAIAIGHPHPATISVLAEDIPRLEARGIRIVFASELVQ
jgi:polysaccharide deacetylase 2 family uncharacterized protein YibQ